MSGDELLALEQARLTLRARHGMAVDRGRIVREAMPRPLADLEATGPAVGAGPTAVAVVIDSLPADRTRSFDGAQDPMRTRRRPSAVRRPPDNFEGPFDLLLQLISRHKLDVTEVALSQVTDEFIAHIKAAGSAWDLDQTSQFLVVAATLLDLKAARLLPVGGDRGRRGPGPAGGPGPAVRAAAAVPGVQAGRRVPGSPRLWPSRAGGSRATSGSSRGSPRCCPRCSSTSPRSGSPRSRPRRWRPSRPT